MGDIIGPAELARANAELLVAHSKLERPENAFAIPPRQRLEIRERRGRRPNRG
jgi:hypothetical protein